MEPPFFMAGWEEWQTYRNDRGQPPWIKVHRRLLRNEKWICLSDSERGQLITLWLLAADHEGAIVASIPMIQKICFMSTPLNMSKFIELGFVRHDGVTLASTWRQSDAPVQSSSEKFREEEISVDDAKPTPKRRQAGASPNRASQWPKDFQLTDHLRGLAETYWKKHGVSFNAEVTWEKFSSSHQSKGSLFVDWEKAWQTWYVNQVDFAKSGTGHKVPLCQQRVAYEGRLKECGKPSVQKIGNRPVCAECLAEYQQRTLREV